MWCIALQCMEPVQNDVMKMPVLHVSLLCADPMLKLLVSPDMVTALVGTVAELTCRVDCFCPGVIAVWSRPESIPLSDTSMVKSIVACQLMEATLMSGINKLPRGGCKNEA